MRPRCLLMTSAAASAHWLDVCCLFPLSLSLSSSLHLSLSRSSFSFLTFYTRSQFEAWNLPRARLFLYPAGSISFACTLTQSLSISLSTCLSHSSLPCAFRLPAAYPTKWSCLRFSLSLVLFVLSRLVTKRSTCACTGVCLCVCGCRCC